MIYQVTEEDLRRCFKFAIKYYLDERTASENRITGQNRGLGGIIDSFIVGKLIEIGVANLIQTDNKEMILDFEIHGINNKNRTDPDITKVKQNGTERNPNLFIEIKNISPRDRWVGLTLEQFNTIKQNTILNKEGSNAYIIYATLNSINEEHNEDLLGVYLKSIIEDYEDNLFERFCDLPELQVEIKYIITIKDLNKKGTKFREGSYLYETELFEETTKFTKNKIIRDTTNQTFQTVDLENNKLPIIMNDGKPIPSEFGEFSYEGNIQVLKKENKSSDRMFVKCNSNTEIKNKVLGKFSLEHGKIYQTLFQTVGRNPTLKRNNIWIAQRNLENISTRPNEEVMSEISELI